MKKGDHRNMERIECFPKHHFLARMSCLSGAFFSGKNITFSNMCCSKPGGNPLHSSLPTPLCSRKWLPSGTAPASCEKRPSQNMYNIHMFMQNWLTTLLHPMRKYQVPFRKYNFAADTSIQSFHFINSFHL